MVPIGREFFCAYLYSETPHGYTQFAMTIADIASILHELTNVFAEFSPLISVITATILTAIISYKKVVTAWPQKNLIG
jgi:hypothetical protein